MPQNYFITGIGTDVGKTVVSAIFAQALESDYWKPVQAGDLDHSDSIKVESWTNGLKIHPEAYRLQSPMSPHAAAKRDGVEIALTKLILPATDNHLIVEGAGGVLVPMDDQGSSYCTWLQQQNIPAIVVSRNYLGSINHTLLTLDYLKSQNIHLEGIVFVGETNTETEAIIETVSALPILARIPWTEKLNKEFVQEQANELRQTTWFQNQKK